MGESDLPDALQICAEIRRVGGKDRCKSWLQLSWLSWVRTE